MTAGFHVSTEELRSHSEAVSAVAEGVDEAAAAAATERAGGLVYGVLFDLVALPFLNLWADRMTAVISGNGELGHAIAGGIAGNAATYDGIEQATARHIGRSGGGGSW
ncbi:MAG: hypothetical protein ABI775_14115 [Pseudonocardiales bacterium]